MSTLAVCERSSHGVMRCLLAYRRVRSSASVETPAARAALPPLSHEYICHPSRTARVECHGVLLRQPVLRPVAPTFRPPPRSAAIREVHSAPLRTPPLNHTATACASLPSCSLKHEEASFVLTRVRPQIQLSSQLLHNHPQTLERVLVHRRRRYCFA
jgi:hypothetical protein